MYETKEIKIAKSEVEQGTIKEDIKVNEMVEGQYYYLKDDLGMCDKYIAVRKGSELTIVALWLEGENYVSDKEHELLFDNQFTLPIDETVLEGMQSDDERSYYMEEGTGVEDITLINAFYYMT